MKRLNLGCGKDYKKGWVNVDADKKVKADFYFDVSKKFPFKDNSFDFILAQDLLEHLTREQAKEFLKECYRVLKPGGRLKIRIPNLFDIFKRFKNDPEVLFKFIYGDTSSHPIFGLHKWAYTKETLKKDLARAGFKLLWIKEVETNFETEAEKIKLPKKPLKIAISGLDSGGWGGAEKFLSQIAEEFKRKQEKIIFLTVKKSQFEQHLKKAKFKTISLPFRNDAAGNLKGLIKFFLFLPASLYLYFKTLKSLKKQGFFILIISGFTDKILLTPLAKMLGFKIVWIEFAPVNFIFNRLFKIPKILYRLTKDLPDYVIVPVLHTKSKIIPQTRISEAKIEVIPCGIKLLTQKQIKAYQKNGSDFRKKLRIQNAFVIGQISRLQKEKGQYILIKAAALTKKKVPNLKVLIIGEGDQLSNLENLAKRLKIEKDIIFLGFIEDVYEALASLDLFVFPSYWEGEGFGLAPLEAASLKKPIIAFDLPPQNIVLENAVLFCKPDEKSLAQSIIKIYKNPKLKKDLSEKTYLKAKIYSIKSIAQKYIELLEKLKNEHFILNR